MQDIDKAIAILGRTHDGDDLTSYHLKLVELGANDGLNAYGKTELEELYRQVMADNYANYPKYLFGIPYLTRDAQGYMYWRDQQVEHFSHTDLVEMRRDAQLLANKCLALEAKGFPVAGRTVTEPAILEAPADMPWLEALLRFYAFFENNGRRVGVFYKQDGSVVILEKTPDERVKVELNPSAHAAYHLVDQQGLRSVGPVRSYGHASLFLQQSGLTPADVHSALGA